MYDMHVSPRGSRFTKTRSLAKNQVTPFFIWCTVHKTMIIPMLSLLAAVAIVDSCHALIIQQETSSSWHPLPHFFARRDMLAAAALASATTTNLLGIESSRAMDLSNTGPRSIASIASNLAIPVWPSWGGGRVVSEKGAKTAGLVVFLLVQIAV
jgi:hypothetical protein